MVDCDGGNVRWIDPFLSKDGFGQCYGSIKMQTKAAVSTLQAGNMESRKLTVVLYAVYSNKTRIIMRSLELCNR